MATEEETVMEGEHQPMQIGSDDHSDALDMWDDVYGYRAPPQDMDEPTHVAASDQMMKEVLDSRGPPTGFHTGPEQETSYLDQLLAESRGLRQSLAGGGSGASTAPLMKTYDQQRELVGETEKKINDAIADQTKVITDFEAKRETLNAVQEDAATKGLARIEAINDEIQNYKIDPNRAFRSTWQVVGAAIASAAGAYAQGISPNRIPNTAMAIINKAIDRDILAQQMELGKLKTSASMQNNVYARMLQQHGDRQRALTEARVAAITVAKLKVSQIMTTAKSANQKLAIQATMQKLHYNQAVSMAQLRATNMATAARSLATDIQAVARLQGKGPVLDDKITKRLKNILPLFDQMKEEFNAISMANWAAYTLGVGQQFGIKGTAKVQAYVQTRTMVTKEIVSIFEGSKPSDLDWKVMVKLFPLARHARGYGLPAIEHMRTTIVTRVGELAAMTPEQRKGATWGLGEAMLKHPVLGKRLRAQGVYGVSDEEVAKTKALAGWKDQD